MTFQTELTDTAPEFLDTLGGESVTYLPASGGSRAITALANRHQPSSMDEVPHGHAPLAVVTVQNDSSLGISSDEIDLGGDKLQYAVRIGQSVQARRITKLVSQDAGMLILEVR